MLDAVGATDAQSELWDEIICSARLEEMGIKRSLRTLQRGRKGQALCPPHIKQGGRYFYRACDVRAWAAQFTDSDELELWDQAECAAYLKAKGVKCSARTLRRGRKGEADSPPHITIGRLVYYRPADVRRWASIKLEAARWNW